MNEIKNLLDGFSRRMGITEEIVNLKIEQQELFNVNNKEKNEKKEKRKESRGSVG